MNVAVHVVAPDIGIVVGVVKKPAELLQLACHCLNVSPAPAVAFMVTLVMPVGTVRVQVLVVPAAVEQVKTLLLPGENCEPPPRVAVMASMMVPFAVAAVESTINVSVLPVPPEVPDEHFGSVLGSAKVLHMSVPLRLTVAVGEPDAVLKVQVPVPALP